MADGSLPQDKAARCASEAYDVQLCGVLSMFTLHEGSMFCMLVQLGAHELLLSFGKIALWAACHTMVVHMAPVVNYQHRGW